MANTLNGIDLFATVVEAGSFAQAAERLHLTRSAVGKGVARLELRLGVQLFHRTTRSQSLTEEGALFYRHCLRALEEVRLGETALASNKLTLNGRLKVSMPVLFGQQCVAPILLALAKAHPGLALELSFSDRKVDLVEEGVDLVIRNAEPPDSLDLAARRLGEHGMTLCASPAYLAERGGTCDPGRVTGARVHRLSAPGAGAVVVVAGGRGMARGSAQRAVADGRSQRHHPGGHRGLWSRLAADLAGAAPP